MVSLIVSLTHLTRLLDYEPLTVFVMKENIYSTERSLMAYAYAMILLFCMICLVLLGIGVKYWRLRNAFQRDKNASASSTSLIKPPSDQLVTRK